CLQGSTTPYSF
nr:immunoglobulin light chain junction region [Macaca mulatta]